MPRIGVSFIPILLFAVKTELDATILLIESASELEIIRAVTKTVDLASPRNVVSFPSLNINVDCINPSTVGVCESAVVAKDVINDTSFVDIEATPWNKGVVEMGIVCLGLNEGLSCATVETVDARLTLRVGVYEKDSNDNKSSRI